MKDVEFDEDIIFPEDKSEVTNDWDVTDWIFWIKEFDKLKIKKLRK